MGGSIIMFHQHGDIMGYHGIIQAKSYDLCLQIEIIFFITQVVGHQIVAFHEGSDPVDGMGYPWWAILQPNQLGH